MSPFRNLDGLGGHGGGGGDLEMRGVTPVSTLFLSALALLTSGPLPVLGQWHLWFTAA